MLAKSTGWSPLGWGLWACLAPFLCAGQPPQRETLSTEAQGSGETQGKGEQAELLRQWVNMLACSPIPGGIRRCLGLREDIGRLRCMP